MLKSGRTVLFENKMSYPRKAITQDRKKDQDGGIAGKKEKEEKRYNGGRADKMKPAAHEISVLIQIIGIKVSEALEFHKLSFLDHTA